MLKLKRGLALRQSGSSLARVFASFDENGDGVIDYQELRTGLAAVGSEVSDSAVSDIMSILDKDGDGSIDYSEFAWWFGTGPPPPPASPEVKAREEAKAAAADAGTGLDAGQLKDALGDALRARGYKEGGVPLAPPPPAMATRGPRRTGSSVGHGEAIRMAAEKRSRQQLMRVKAQLSGVFRSTGAELGRVFRSFDLDGNGAVDRAELKQGLASLGDNVIQ
jgi:Ca2+-binding EF-hand superfamily protein